MSKVIYLKDYIKQKDGPLEDKIVVGSDIRPAQAVNLAYNNNPLQIVTGGFDEAKVVSIKNNLDRFIKDPAPYVLGVAECDMYFQQKFFKNSKKKDFLLQIENFLSARDYRKVREDIYLIADELFTNFSKSAESESKSMMFGIESCGESIIAYCKDSFGTLKPKVMLENIHRCYADGVKNSIRMSPATGAGIGSYLMYRLSCGMAMAVRPGKESMVLLWMPLKEFHEDRIEMNKSLIVIEDKES
ncbi:MAG: hypothetical protein HRT44_04985 [Bdellovibrionales bacterium]|nr:hypothetical protein [Bdellovibrionales bacterium]NQZ18596.1 hypothetical protein [Bdellovibrionales bacterium]